MTKHYNPDLPLVVGLAGGYATGKTATANGLAPNGRLIHPPDEDESGPRIEWDHFYFALPLYRMATARQSIEGDLEYDRMAYEILLTLLDVVGTNPLFGSPPFNDLIQMAYEITEYPCPREGKPRSFLQWVGTDLLRAYDEDVWVKWMGRKIATEHRLFRQEHLDVDGYLKDDAPLYGVVVSDCRFDNELKLIRDHPNGILIKLTASPEVVENRQLMRDGYTMSESQKNHQSETSLQLPDELYDAIINTDNISVTEQVNQVKRIVSAFTGAEHFA